MADSTTFDPPPPLAGEAAGGLLSAGFLGLLMTQLLTAINDNIFRWLVIGISKQYVDEAQYGTVLMAGTACFVLPYLLLAAPAGYLADRFSKRSVIVGCKLAEIAIMALGLAAILVGNLWAIFLVVACMGAQSALFSPAKLASIPELLKAEKISAANGLFGLTTVIATVIGMAVGSLLSDWTHPRGTGHWWLSALVLLGVALVGTLCSLLIRRVPAARPERTIPWDAPVQTVRDLRTLSAQRALLRVALGIVFFWSLGSVAQLNIDRFATEAGGVYESDKTPLLMALVLGVGVGSVLAGWWSAGRVELGIVPLGAAGVAVSSMLLFTVHGTIIEPGQEWTPALLWALLLLFLLGTSAGLFDVPLEAYLQHRSPRQSRGAILAAVNLLTFSGILGSALLFALLTHVPLSSRQIFLLFGVVTVPVCAYIVWLIPQASIRFLVWLASHTVYRIQVVGREHLPETGGAVLAANHVSWLDGVLLLMTSSRPIRMIVYAGNFRNRWLRRLAHLWGAILIDSGPKSVRTALELARQAVQQGELVCIFPEGAITRTGEMQPFKPGLMKIIQGTEVPVIPVYLHGLWGSIFSFYGGKFFWKWPGKWPYPIAIFFGKPITSPQNVEHVRQAVEQLAITAGKEAAQYAPSE